MGMRHQIYIVLPYTFKQKNRYSDDDLNDVEYKKSNIVALHNHWLFGVLAGQQLLQFLSYFEKGIEAYNDSFILHKEGGYKGNPELLSASLYSLNTSTGYFEQTLIMGYDMAHNPHLGDNDTGITIIDLRESVPKYCFMFLFSDDNNISNYLTPLSAKEYMNNFYGEHVLLKKSYWKNNLKQFEDSKVQMEFLNKDLDRFEVLSLSDVQTLFPLIFIEDEEN